MSSRRSFALFILLCIFIYSSGLALAQVKGKGKGVKTEKDSSTELYTVIQGGKVGYIDAKGNIKITPQFTSAGEFNEGLAFVNSGGKLGYIDTKGEMKIPPAFFIAGNFKEGLAWVHTGETVGYIDKKGNMVKTLSSATPPINEVEPNDFDKAVPISNPSGVRIKGSLVNEDNEDWYRLNGQLPIISIMYVSHEPGADFDLEFYDAGKKLLSKAISVNNPEILLAFMPLNGDYLRVVKYSGSGNYTLYINPESSGDFNEGFAWTRMGNKIGFIDKKCNPLGSETYVATGNFSEGMARVFTDYKKNGFINKKGEMVINPQFDAAGDFKEGLCWVRNNNIEGYIDRKGTIVIPLQYKLSGNFSQGLAWVKDGASNKYGYIDKTGKYVINPQYDGAGDFCDGLAWVKQNNKEGYINKKGEMVITPQFDTAYNFIGGLAKVEIKSGNMILRGYVNKKGEYIWNPQM